MPRSLTYSRRCTALPHRQRSRRRRIYDTAMTLPAPSCLCGRRHVPTELCAKCGRVRCAHCACDHYHCTDHDKVKEP